MRDTNIDFKKSLGRFEVQSYGGGSPRWVGVTADNREELRGSMDDVRDLHYLLGRLIKDAGYD